jgi:hypothetical protein
MLLGVSLSTSNFAREFGDHDVKGATTTEDDSVCATENLFAAQ